MTKASRIIICDQDRTLHRKVPPKVRCMAFLLQPRNTPRSLGVTFTGSVEEKEEEEEGILAAAQL